MIVVLSILVFLNFKENANIFIKYIFAIDFGKYILSDKGSSVVSLGTYIFIKIWYFIL